MCICGCASMCVCMCVCVCQFCSYKSNATYKSKNRQSTPCSCPLTSTHDMAHEPTYPTHSINKQNCKRIFKLVLREKIGNQNHEIRVSLSVFHAIYFSIQYIWITVFSFSQLLPDLPHPPTVYL